MATTYTTSTRTRTDRYGGYSGYGRRFEEDEQEQQTMFNDSFDVEENQETAYEVQKNYSFDSSSDVIYEEHQKTMAMPNVIRKARAIETPHEENKVRIRARAKIAITVYSIILVALIAFAIYNSIAINNMQAEVAAKNQTYISQTLVINDLLAEYNNLGSDLTIIEKTQGEFVEPTENDIVRVSKSTMETRPETVVETNWFEELCEFLNNLFS